MRPCTLLPPVVSACLVLATFVDAACALERASARYDEPSAADPWTNCATVTIRYYNTCTGWIWILSGFQASDRFGVAFDANAAHGLLCSTSHYYYSGAPSGWGFTGTMTVHYADENDCPAGPPLDMRTHLPTTGWTQHDWILPTGFGVRFLVLATLGPGESPPVAVATDHPAAVGGGPPACGTCYPVTRQNRSWYFGPDGACPPVVLFHDPVCDAQLLWEAGLSLEDPIGTESWARVKSLFR